MGLVSINVDAGKVFVIYCRCKRSDLYFFRIRCVCESYYSNKDAKIVIGQYGSGFGCTRSVLDIVTRRRKKRTNVKHGN